MKLPTFLAAQAVQRPVHTALIGERRMTFAQLEDSTTRAAAAMRRRGLRVGDRVAIALPNGSAFVEAFLAVVKAGLVAVPVNLRLAPDEVEYILDDCTPAAVIREPAEVAELIESGDPVQPEVPQDFDDCVISYTSGTTGKPKGAVLTQANYIVLNGFLNGRMWNLAAEDRQLVTTPLAQRTGLARVMNMICHGCTLVVPPKFDPTGTADLIESERVTFMATVPTVARMMLPEIERDPARFASLRAFVATGEAFPLGLKRQLQELLPHLEIHSYYAMTEVGLVASMGPAGQFDHPSAVGRVQPGMEVRLLNNEFHEVPAGEVGELWVRSGPPGRWLTMREYFRRPEDTARTIRDGWVATGDLGRFDDENFLHLVDRKKDMILSGGFNIYSREVELVVAELPGVQGVAVVGVPDEVYGESVAAYIEVAPGYHLIEQDVIDHCRQRIASYKKPRHVHFVDQLPRNSAGKVLKRLLTATH
ncbi:class I adenylate-forming enzyme family protein [Streptomyces melanosporofaciens]|uniref:Long-chain acyl-CoA synthetase n=1 Tax=Streptomyces melanosporofaciens TaxID=67327 RepID=A0A1H4KL21_STRMJ|nr:AMP-binding protein [Streptomyces melanosporofaciens]SEB58808.1 long-chain acyl-CoA synthetase [Streptomyces melanosporofaciens]